VSFQISGGFLYAAFQDSASGMATAMKFNGTGWDLIGSANFSAGTATYVSLQVYNGTPYVGFIDGGNSNKPTVMTFNGTDWVLVGNPGFSVNAADSLTLQVYNGTLYLAYRDAVLGKTVVDVFH